MRGFNRRLKTLEALLSGGGSSPTVYEFGTDIPLPPNVVSVDATVTRVGGLCLLSGRLQATGAIDWITFLDLSDWPVETQPRVFTEESIIATWVIYGRDDSASISKPGRANMYHENGFVVFDIGFLDGTMVAANDSIALAGAYIPVSAT